MKIIHISDLHFGTGHWAGNDTVLLEKINSFQADIVINTGDSTCDSLENEFEAASEFLQKIKCENLISIMGNHDKRNRRAHEFFKKYIHDTEVIFPKKQEHTTKSGLFINQKYYNVQDNYTDINFIKTISIDGKSILIIGLDTTVLRDDDGYIEEEVLHAISDQISQANYDECLLLCHHSVLGTDECPFHNSLRLMDFINKHKIKHVFCGHTHEFSLIQAVDLYKPHRFTHYMCGTTTSSDTSRDDNILLFYENFGSDQMRVHRIRIFSEGGTLSFKEEVI